MLRYIVPFLPGAAVGIGNAGLQVSGYQNFPLAVGLWVLMIFLLFVAAAYNMRNARIRQNKRFRWTLGI
jgi:hypothetical protein